MSSSIPMRAWAEISLESLEHNIKTLQALYAQGSADLMAVVKADAYGHDIEIIAPYAYRQGLRHFGVATTDEGMLVRRLVPNDANVYVLSPVVPADAERIVEDRLIAVVGDFAMAMALSSAAAAKGVTADIHLDVDTGMGRSGVAVSAGRELFDKIRSLDRVRLTGVTTHFASADEDVDDARQQHELFTAFLNTVMQGDPTEPVVNAGRSGSVAGSFGIAPTHGTQKAGLTVHAANSPASLVLGQPSYHQLVRAGLLLYGIEPAVGMFASSSVDIRPVMTLKASVTLCRELAGGATVSYGKTYRVPEGGGTYATIGIGYGDGYPRRLGNLGWVLLNGRRAPICGRVCMDQFVVDVSGISDVRAGDVAMLIGRDGDEEITILAMADLVGTTPHEISTCLTPRTPRVAVS